MSDLSSGRERVIWKFQIPLANSFEIDLPAGYRVLNVSEQFGNGYIWIMVNPISDRNPIRFQLIATEQNFDTAFVGEYLGTYFLVEKMITIHVFEAPESTRTYQ